MAGRTLVTHVTVLGEDGLPTVLPPGPLPAWAESRITNPAVFADEADHGTTTAETAPESTAGPDTGTAGGPPIYEAMKLAELQAEASKRGIAASGTKETVRARLEADDRERAN